jgi:hypothetical protein
MICSRDLSAWSLHEDPNTVFDTLPFYTYSLFRKIFVLKCVGLKCLLLHVVFIGSFRHEDHQIVKWFS